MFEVEDGVAFLGPDLSELERRILRAFERVLLTQGYRYLSTPSSLKWNTLSRQSVVTEDHSLGVDDIHCLSGSGEQGILERFSDTDMYPSLWYTENQCWRNESATGHIGLKTLKEFRKLEQFAFVDPADWEIVFEIMLETAYQFLNQFPELDVRVIDCTKSDPGYHILKYDVEVWTEEYGWMETHSCSYFGSEQVDRFGIGGGVHTISNTGIATPRVLIPFIEKRIGFEHPVLKRMLG